MNQPVVDAFVESSNDDGATWKRLNGPQPDLRWFDGPWSVPHAIEIARECWSAFLRIAIEPLPPIRVRVVDTAGVVVEQWPKRV